MQCSSAAASAQVCEVDNLAGRIDQPALCGAAVLVAVDEDEPVAHAGAHSWDRLVLLREAPLLRREVGGESLAFEDGR